MELKKAKSKRKPKVTSEATDSFTGAPIKKGESVRVFGGISDKKHLIFDIGGNKLSKKDPRVEIDFVDKEHGVIKSEDYAVLTGGTLKKRKVKYTAYMRNYPSIVIPYPDDNTHQCHHIVSETLAKQIGLKESKYDGFYYHPSCTKASPKPIKYRTFPVPVIDKTSRADLVKYGAYSPTFLITEGKKFSFGIELETSAGYISDYHRKDLNMQCVYDGSILDDNGRKHIGGEYVTGVLSGDNGLRHLYKITNTLSARCSLNNTCSVHVHLGGIDFNKEMIVLLWKVNQLLEDELFSMMPASRLTRAHCRRMKKVNFNFKKPGVSYKMNIDNYFDKIFRIVSLGPGPSKDVNKNFNHPAGSNCGYDTSTPRYWWINFVPAMFNLKGKENYTIEYRMHSASLNFTKIKNWILIVMGITSLCIDHKRFVIDSKKITLDDVMRLTFPKKAQYLIDYIDQRKKLFADRNNNLSEKAEYIVDKDAKSNNKTVRETLWV